MTGHPSPAEKRSERREGRSASLDTESSHWYTTMAPSCISQSCSPGLVSSVGAVTEGINSLRRFSTCFGGHCVRRRDKPLCTSAVRLCISLQRGVRMLHVPYSVSNACFKGKLHLVLVIPFPLNSLLYIIPQMVLFIRRRSGLSMSICG